MITTEQANDIRTRNEQVHAWMKERKVNSYYPEQLAKELGIALPTNDELSALEVYEFHTNPPERYFIYIDAEQARATTWTGENLGRVSFGNEYRSNMGDKRVNITIVAVNGRVYHGTYYKGAGDYARVKMAKERRVTA